MQRVIHVFQQVFPDFERDAVERIIALGSDSYRSLSRQQIEVSARAGLTAFGEDLRHNTNTHFQGHWEKIAIVRAEQGAQLDEVTRVIMLGADVMDSHVRARLADDPEARAWWFDRLYHIMSNGLLMLGRVFMGARERMINEQNIQLRELSTPLIPLHKGVLVLPLVGQIDQRRASQILETLLEGISIQSASVVIIDITGVPVVDTEVANYLIQAARAARLLGAHIVLVGLGPEVAQTIVQLGVDLSDIITRANLEAGISYALRLQGLTIAPINSHRVVGG